MCIIVRFKKNVSIQERIVVFLSWLQEFDLHILSIALQVVVFNFNNASYKSSCNRPLLFSVIHNILKLSLSEFNNGIIQSLFTLALNLFYGYWPKSFLFLIFYIFFFINLKRFHFFKQHFFFFFK